MSWISGSPLDDAQGHIHNNDCIAEEQETVRCEMDSQIYLKEECVYDSAGNCYVHKNNLNSYLENFTRDMCSEEYNQFEKELKDQL